MQICFSCLRMRRISLAARTRPIQVNRNDELIAIASPSFFLNPYSARSPKQTGRDDRWLDAQSKCIIGRLDVLNAQVEFALRAVMRSVYEHVDEHRPSPSGSLRPFQEGMCQVRFSCSVVT